MTDYEKIYNFENLYRAYRKARQGKRWKGAAAKFEVNLLEALNLLRYQLQTKKYTLSPYNTFEVYEPKRRVVMSNAYKDKVVQHSLCDNVLEPILTRSFITDNYASQVGKGTHYGLDRLQEFLRRFYRKNGIDVADVVGVRRIRRNKMYPKRFTLSHDPAFSTRLTYTSHQAQV